MFSLKNQAAKLTNVNPRAELHGQDKKLAVARAKSAAKATGRCEVFALVPVGIATRKQIQAVEFKERVA